MKHLLSILLLLASCFGARAQDAPASPFPLAPDVPTSATELVAAIRKPPDPPPLALVNIANMSPTWKRTRWIDVVLPAAVVQGDAQLRVGPRASPWVALPGRTVGTIGRVVHIRAQDLPPGVHRDIPVWASETDEAPQPYTGSPWITWDMAAAMPRPLVLIGGKQRRLDPSTERLAPIYQGNATHVYEHRGRIAGTQLVWHCYLHVPTLQDVVDVEWTITCSDPRTEEMAQNHGGIGLEVKQYLHAHHAAHAGYPPPVRVGDRWVQVLTGAGFLGNGQQISGWGRVLCLPPNVDDIIGPGYIPRLQTLLAERDGPALAVCTTWHRH